MLTETSIHRGDSDNYISEAVCVYTAALDLRLHCALCNVLHHYDAAA